MRAELECIPCLARQAAEAVSLAVEEPARRQMLLRRLLREIAEVDWNTSPPAIAQRVHQSIRTELGCADPYREIKARMNQAAAALLPQVAAAAQRQPNPREALVRLAIAGNLLDAGAQLQVGPEELSARLDAIWTEPFWGDADALFRAADEAHCILYLADNAGEIFFDRLLIEALPAEKMTVIVRGAPVLNDATIEDAEAAGLPELVPVFDNGSDAPGTILEDTSPSFRAWFDRADLIIAKGQGNFESLCEINKRIVFLFTVKCPVVAARVGWPVGSLIAKEQEAE